MSKGTKLNRAEQEELQERIEHQGAHQTAQYLRLSDATALRAAAGAPIHPSTAHLIRLGLMGIVLPNEYAR